MYTKSQLLTLRPRHDAAQLPEQLVAPTAEVENTSSSMLEGSRSILSTNALLGVPADVLARECNSVRVIQKAWMRHAANAPRRQKLQTDFRALPEASWSVLYSLFVALPEPPRSAALDETNLQTSQGTHTFMDRAVVGLPFLAFRDVAMACTASSWHGGFCSTLLLATLDSDSDEASEDSV